jgi:predicted nucleotidyltransferase
MSESKIYGHNTSLRHLDKAKEAILNIENDAAIYLFGSRVTGTATEDSDWDLLILLPGKVDWKRKEKIIESLVDIEIKYKEIFGIVVIELDKWNSEELFHATPFYNNVNQEIIAI